MLKFIKKLYEYGIKILNTFLQYAKHWRKMNPTPSVLYKYMTCEVAEKVLNNNTLRATPPNDFNDPFEMLPKSYSGITDEKIYDMAKCKAYSREYYELLKKKFVDYNAYCIYLTQNPSVISDIVKSLKKNLQNRDFRNLIDQAAKIFGVLCLSGEKDNILMWSHYADDHKGVVIGFKAENLSNKWFPVNYTKERIDIPFGEPVESDAYQESVYDILRTKYEKWHYECEYRFFTRLDKCKKSDIDGKKMYFFSFTDDSIAEVILGAKMDNDNKIKIKNIVCKNKNIRTLEAQIDMHEFKINVQPFIKIE